MERLRIEGGGGEVLLQAKMQRNRADVMSEDRVEHLHLKTKSRHEMTRFQNQHSELMFFTHLFSFSVFFFSFSFFFVFFFSFDFSSKSGSHKSFDECSAWIFDPKWFAQQIR